MLRYLINRSFQRDLRNYGLDDDYVWMILNEILKGRTISLGSKLYKVRSAPEGKGKSGGFRTVFFWKHGEMIVFCALFGKNEQDHILPDERKALKILSKEYDRLAQREVGILIKSGQWKEIPYDQ